MGGSDVANGEIAKEIDGEHSEVGMGVVHHVEKNRHTVRNVMCGQVTQHVGLIVRSAVDHQHDRTSRLELQRANPTRGSDT